MNSRSAPLAIFAFGVLCFGFGIILRFRAAEMAAAATPGMRLSPFGNPLPPGWATAMAAAQRSNAMYDVAQPLLWTGGALIVLVAIALLFVPGWRLPNPEETQVGGELRPKNPLRS